LWCGVVVYVAVSFRLMRAHVAGRATAASLREALRELFWTGVSQPFLPLFYAVGRRLGNGGGDVPVVCVHGYMQNRVDFIALARQLEKSGAGAIYGFNYPWFDTVEKNAARLSRFVESVRSEQKVDRVDIVAHSLGAVLQRCHRGGQRLSPKAVRDERAVEKDRADALENRMDPLRDRPDRFGDRPFGFDEDPLGLWGDPVRIDDPSGGVSHYPSHIPLAPERCA
jgi:hypothetical protein